MGLYIPLVQDGMAWCPSCSTLIWPWMRWWRPARLEDGRYLCWSAECRERAA